MRKIHDMFAIKKRERQKCVSSQEKNHEGKNDTLIKIQYNLKSMQYSDDSINTR